jgi:hypothetical protein
MTELENLILSALPLLSEKAKCKAISILGAKKIDSKRKKNLYFLMKKQRHT